MLEPPGPRGVPVFGSLPALCRGAPSFFQAMAAQYGDIAQFKMGRHQAYLVSAPEAIQQVFEAERHGDYNKQSFHTALSSAFGDSVLTSLGGPAWRRKRDRLQPLFTRSAVIQWFPLIRAQTEQRLAQWQSVLRTAGDLDVATEINRLVEGIMARLLFGEHVNENETVAAMRTINRRLYWQLMTYFVAEGRVSRWLGERTAFRQALNDVDTEIQRLSRLVQPGDHSSILASIDPATMSSQSLRDELFTLYFAGQDTTTAAISWMLYRLALHPEYQTLIADEVGRTLEEAPLCDNGYPILRRFIAESMRLHPPVFSISRTPRGDEQLAGFRIRAGASVLIPQLCVHHHPKLWHQPDRFDPGRFTRSKSTGRSRYAYFPFSAGERTCLGLHLAMNEIRTIVAAIVQRFSIRLTTHRPIRAAAGITLKPKALPVQLIPRA